MAVKFTNNAATTLAAGINSSVTSISVTDGSVFPALTGSDHFYVTFDDTTNREIVKVTARSGNTLTVVRGQDNTTAQAFNSGDKAELRVVAALLEDITTEVTSTLSVDTFTGDGTTTAFTLSQAPSSEDNLIVFIEGAYQNPGDFVLSGTTLTLDEAPVVDRNIIVYHVKGAVSGNNLNQDSFTADGNTAAFTLSIAPIHENNTQVFIDGVYQQKNSYSISGTTLTLDANPSNGATVEVMTFTQTEVNTLPASFVSGLTEVTAVGADHFMIFDATDSALKKSLVSDVLESATSISTSADATAITIDSSENVTFTNNVTINSGQLTAGGLAYPTSDGTNGQVLTTDGAGTLSFSTISGYTDSDVETYLNTSEIYTDPTNNRIGIGTSSPSAKLEVIHGNVSQGNGVTFGRTASQSWDFWGDSGANVLYSKGNFAIIGTSDSQDLSFRTNNTDRMRIHASGCVGINSTADRSIGTNIGTLVVNGSAGGGLWLSTGDSSATTTKIYSKLDSSVGELIINQGSGVGGGSIKFTHNESATPTMTLQSNKNVLIGDITSDLITYGKLQVAGGGYTAGFGGIVGFFDTDVSVASSNLIQLLAFSSDTDATGGQFIRFSDSNSTMGSVSAASGTTVSYNTSSDRRMKKNIVDASSQLDVINNIQIKEFDWIKNGHHEVGVIAQELNEVIPNVVQEGGEDVNEEPWGVDYGKLTPYLIKAMQEQQTIIDDLKTRIEALEG